MAKKIHLKKVALGVLSLSMATTLATGLAMLNVDKVSASETEVLAKDLVTLSDATANVQLHDAKYDYTGLTIGATGVNPYSGSFNGVFDGSTTVTYKFNGTGTGDQLGAFKWIIKSVKDSSQSYTIEISPNWNASFQVTRNKIFGYASNSTTVNYLVNGTTSATGTGVAYDKDTKAPSFHTDTRPDNTNKKGLEELYLETSTDGLSISYLCNDYNTKSANLITLNEDVLDISEGYTISFESDWDPQATCSFASNTGKAKYKFGGASTYAEIVTTSEYYARSCPITVVALNDFTFDKESYSFADTYQEYYFCGEVLSTEKVYELEQNETYNVESATIGTIYNSDGSSFKAVGAKELVNDTVINTSACGTYTFTLDDKTYTYTVSKDIATTGIISAQNAVPQLAEQGTTYPYTGITLATENNKDPYSGSFNGVFNGSTTIEYKFTGAGTGDALGAFKWIIRSAKNSAQSFTVEISEHSNKLATDATTKEPLYYGINRTDIFGYFEEGGTMYYCASGTSAKTQDWGFLGQTVNTSAPSFHADDRNVSKKWATEKLYLEVGEEGLSVSYMLNDFSTKSAALITLNGEQLDISEGYIVEFESDWDPTRKITRSYKDANGVQQTKEIGLKYNEVEVTEGRSAAVTLIALNGLALGNDSISVSDITSTCKVGDVELKADEVNVLPVGEAETEVEFISTTYIYNDTTTGSSFYQAVKETKTIDLSQATSTETTVEIGGVTYTYVVKNEISLNYVVNGVTTTQIVEDTSIELAVEEIEGKKFIGWYIDSLEGLYPVGYNYEVVNNDTLTAVFLEFNMIAGASIRTSAPYGIRFINAYNTSEYTSLQAYAGENALKFGTIILPTDTLDKEFVLSNFEAGKTIIDIDGSKNLSNVDKLLPNQYNADNTYYSGTIVNLKEENIAREFSARGYVAVTYANGSTEYIYTDYVAADHSRSAYYVANAAVKNNEEGSALQGYINAVADVTVTVNEDVVSVSNVNTNATNSPTINEMQLVYTKKVSCVRVNNTYVIPGKTIIRLNDINYNVSYTIAENTEDSTWTVTLTVTPVNA